MGWGRVLRIPCWGEMSLQPPVHALIQQETLHRLTRGDAEQPTGARRPLARAAQWGTRAGTRPANRPPLSIRTATLRARACHESTATRSLGRGQPKSVREEAEVRLLLTSHPDSTLWSGLLPRWELSGQRRFWREVRLPAGARAAEGVELGRMSYQSPSQSSQKTQLTTPSFRFPLRAGGTEPLRGSPREAGGGTEPVRGSPREAGGTCRRGVTVNSAQR